MEVEVRLVGQEEPTKITLRKYTAGERNSALREAAKITGNMKNPDGSFAFDYVLFNELRVVAAIESPKELKTLQAVRERFYPEDYDRVLAKVDEVAEVTPLKSTA